MKPAKHLPKSVDAALKLVNGAPRLRKMMKRAEPSNSSFVNGVNWRSEHRNAGGPIDQKTIEPKWTGRSEISISFVMKSLAYKHQK